MTVVALTASVLLLQGPADSQAPAGDDKAPPKGAGGPIGDIAQGLMPGEEISLTPWSKKIMDTRLTKDDPEANCLPTGVPRIAPYPWRILQTQTHIFYLFEGNIHSFRQIFIDGRPHLKDPDPTWYGDSIGTRIPSSFTPSNASPGPISVGWILKRRSSTRWPTPSPLRSNSRPLSGRGKN